MEVAEPWARQPPTLPVDLLLDIIARCDSDAKTVVRCGLVCKDVRTAMLGPGFHARLGRRGGFDPGLLVAVSYRLSGCYRNIEGTVIRNDPIVVQPPGHLPRFDTNLLGTLDPTASSRDGFLILRENEMLATGFAFRHGLRVCNTITGHVTSLPSTSIGLRASGVYQPALLSVDDDAARSFKLLVMCSKLNGRLLTQTFSSQEGEWGAARKIHINNNLPPGVQGLYEASSTAPAVVWRSVHWLCYTNPVSVYADRELIILAVRAESACANVIKLPQELLIRMGSPSSGWTSWWTSYAGRFMLAATATAEGERRLSLVAAEPFVISMWTLVLHPDEGSSILWSRQEVIQRQEIVRPLTGVLHASHSIRFSMFGERSGTVLFWMQIGETNQAILVQLNLVTKKTLVLWRGSDHCCNYTAHALLHETSLISVLKSF
jgi:hypothetical protein